MPTVRPINSKKYGISKHKFGEVYNFALQYPEWRDELKYMTTTVKSAEITDMPCGGGGSGNPTESLAIRRDDLERKCTAVEQSALEAGRDLAEWILKAVTEECVTYNYLYQICKIPCSRNTFYECRRKFYWLLSKKI